MIKVNLLPVRRKKKAKPLPSFLIISVLCTVVVALLMAYLTFFFSSRLSAKKNKVAENDRTNAQLKEQIKAVEDFEKRNEDFRKRNDVFEQLNRNRSLPVRVLTEISSLLPTGIWLNVMTISGNSIGIDGYGFTNAEIVTYVDNLKKSPLFADVYLQESKSAEIEKMPLYAFKLNFNIKN
ncbi:MAG: PilN domain-containing protein [Nitrospirota bacterium]